MGESPLPPLRDDQLKLRTDANQNQILNPFKGRSTLRHLFKMPVKIEDFASKKYTFR